MLDREPGAHLPASKRYRLEASKTAGRVCLVQCNVGDDLIAQHINRRAVVPPSSLRRPMPDCKVWNMAFLPVPPSRKSQHSHCTSLHIGSMQSAI
jgi:hypothetical protein